MADATTSTAPAATGAAPSPSAAPTSPAPVPTTPASSWLSPERVAHAEFRSSFRGLDPTEVRSFLARVASELRTLLDAQEDLRARVDARELRTEPDPEPAEATPEPVVEPLDIRRVTELLGQETARVLEVAREAAVDIRAKAEAASTAMLEAAETDAARLRDEAAAVLAERTEEAEAAAQVVRDEADAYAAQTRGDADTAATAAREEASEAAQRVRAEADSEAAQVRAEATEALGAAKAQASQLLTDAKDAATKLAATAQADAEAAREAGRDEGRRMVAEAKAVRERILADMARRRNVARQQIERVRAARERLLEAIEAVRVSVTDAHAELNGSLVEAKLAGDRAARQVDVEALPTMRELESEVELAKDTGLIDVAEDTFGDEDDDELSGEDDSVIDTGEFAALTSDKLAAVDGPADEEPDQGAGPGPTGAADGGDDGDRGDGGDDRPDGGPGPDGDTDLGDEADRDRPSGDDVIDLTDVEESDVEPVTMAEGRVRAKTQPPAGELFARLRGTPEGPPTHSRNGTAAAGSPTNAKGGGGANGSKRPDAPTGAVALADHPAAGANGDDGNGTPAATGEQDATVAPAAPAAPKDRVELHKRDALLAGTVRDVTRQMKLALSDQQNELLEAVRAQGSGKGGSGTGNVVPTASELAASYEPVIAAQLASAAQLGWRAIAPDDADAGPVPVGELTATLAAALGNELHSRLARDDDAKVDEAHLADRVRAAYREVRAQRLGDLAEHAVLGAFGCGQLAAAQPGLQLRWAYDSCGPDCLDNALAGPLSAGETFPTGHRHPPAFEGCRCLLVLAKSNSTAG